MTTPAPPSPLPATEPLANAGAGGKVLDAPTEARQQQLFRHTLRESRIHPLAPLLRRYRSQGTPAAPNNPEEDKHA